MVHLIDKSALVAEIEKLKGKVSDSSSYCNGWQHALRMLELSLDTLEVKEVDLREEIDVYFQKNKNGYNGLLICKKEDFSVIAKHFFELGLSVNNPITAADRGTAEEKMISYDKEIKWLNKIKEL